MVKSLTSLNSKLEAGKPVWWLCTTMQRIQYIFWSDVYEWEPEKQSSLLLVLFRFRISRIRQQVMKNYVPIRRLVCILTVMVKVSQNSLRLLDMGDVANLVRSDCRQLCELSLSFCTMG